MGESCWCIWGVITWDKVRNYLSTEWESLSQALFLAQWSLAGDPVSNQCQKRWSSCALAQKKLVASFSTGWTLLTCTQEVSPSKFLVTLMLGKGRHQWPLRSILGTEKTLVLQVLGNRSR